MPRLSNREILMRKIDNEKQRELAKIQHEDIEQLKYDLFDILSYRWYQHGDGSRYTMDRFEREYPTDESIRKGYIEAQYYDLRRKTKISKPKSKRKPCSCKRK